MIAREPAEPMRRRRWRLGSPVAPVWANRFHEEVSPSHLTPPDAAWKGSKCGV